MIKHKKILKPIDIDVHFKYRCPKCSSEHWLSLNEARTKNFKIVCDCKKIFYPKKIAKLQIVYSSKKPKKEKIVKSFIEPEPPQTLHKTINPELLSKCLPVLINYGFTKQESEKLLCEAYQIEQSEDCGQLVKLALKSLGVKNE